MSITLMLFKTFHCSGITLYASRKIFGKDILNHFIGWFLFISIYRDLLLLWLDASAANSVSGKTPRFPALGLLGVKTEATIAIIAGGAVFHVCGGLLN